MNMRRSKSREARESRGGGGGGTENGTGPWTGRECINIPCSQGKIV